MAAVAGRELDTLKHSVKHIATALAVEKQTYYEYLTFNYIVFNYCTLNNANDNDNMITRLILTVSKFQIY